MARRATTERNQRFFHRAGMAKQLLGHLRVWGKDTVKCSIFEGVNSIRHIVDRVIAMTSKLLVVTCLFCLAGCSKSAPDSAATAPSAAASKSACDLHLVTAQDAAALLNRPVSQMENIPGDAQSCHTSDAGMSDVTISLRPGHGIVALKTYTSGKMDEYEKSEPLTGIGDEAVRSLALNRVIARKGDLLCETTGPGLSPPAGDPMIGKLGGLCNKIFSSYNP